VQVDIRGRVPKIVKEQRLAGQVDTVRKGYEYFERDAEVDEQERRDFIDQIKTAPPPSSNERKLLFRSLEYADYRAVGGRVEKITSISGLEATPRSIGSRFRCDNTSHLRWNRLQSGGSDFAVKCFQKIVAGEPFIWGKATAPVHAPASQVVSWLYHYTSYCRMKAHERKEGNNLLRKIYKPKKVEGEVRSGGKKRGRSEEGNTRFWTVTRSLEFRAQRADPLRLVTTLLVTRLRFLLPLFIF